VAGCRDWTVTPLPQQAALLGHPCQGRPLSETAVAHTRSATNVGKHPLAGRFADIVMNATEREIAADVTLNGRLLLAQEKTFSISYAPWVRPATSV
jgi:hypothetical protein